MEGLLYTQGRAGIKQNYIYTKLAHIHNLHSFGAAAGLTAFRTVDGLWRHSCFAEPEIQSTLEHLESAAAAFLPCRRQKSALVYVSHKATGGHWGGSGHSLLHRPHLKPTTIKRITDDRSQTLCCLTQTSVDWTAACRCLHTFINGMKVKLILFQSGIILQYETLTICLFEFIWIFSTFIQLGP